MLQQISRYYSEDVMIEQTSDSGKARVYIEGRWQRLLNVGRMGIHPLNAQISVAEHSWVTAMLCMMFFDEVLRESKSEDYELLQLLRLLRAKVMEKALVHDLEEAIIGDIPRISSTYETSKPLKNKAVSLVNEELFDGMPFSFAQTRSCCEGWTQWCGGSVHGRVLATCGVCEGDVVRECTRERSIRTCTLAIVGERKAFPS